MPLHKLSPAGSASTSTSAAARLECKLHCLAERLVGGDDDAVDSSRQPAERRSIRDAVVGAPASRYQGNSLAALLAKAPKDLLEQPCGAPCWRCCSIVRQLLISASPANRSRQPRHSNARTTLVLLAARSIASMSSARPDREYSTSAFRQLEDTPGGASGLAVRRPASGVTGRIRRSRTPCRAQAPRSRTQPPRRDDRVRQRAPSCDCSAVCSLRRSARPATLSAGRSRSFP